MSTKNILVATDFSPHADEALERAIEIGRSEGARITVLHACPPPAYAFPYPGLPAPTPELVADFQEAAKEQLGALKQRLAARNITVATACIVGEPRDVITRYAAEHGHDLIVTGSHGRRGFRRFFLGSVAEHVVRAATVPVLVVHRAAAESEKGEHHAAP